MRLAILGDGALRSDERLREHLTTVDSPGAEVPVLAAIDVDLEWLEV
jgi:hypothetical protein